VSGGGGGTTSDVIWCLFAHGKNKRNEKINTSTQIVVKPTQYATGGEKMTMVASNWRITRETIIGCAAKEGVHEAQSPSR
jgi:hypothetical protein